MATIRVRSHSYRAEVVRLGVRRSATFPSLEAAEAWASETESAVLAERAPHMLRPPMPVHLTAACKPTLAGKILSADQLLALPRWADAVGIYFLLSGEEVVYVGQSTRVHQRVAQHRAKWKVFDTYTFIPCDPSELMDLERYYIQALRPELNSSGL